MRYLQAHCLPSNVFVFFDHDVILREEAEAKQLACSADGVFSHCDGDVVERHSSRKRDSRVGVMEMSSSYFAHFLEEGEVGVVSVEGVEAVELECWGVLIEFLGANGVLRGFIRNRGSALEFPRGTCERADQGGMIA